jgi:hypothetical protein
MLRWGEFEGANNSSSRQSTALSEEQKEQKEKNNNSEGFCGWQPRWMMIRKNDFFLSYSEGQKEKKENETDGGGREGKFWEACTWCRQSLPQAPSHHHRRRRRRRRIDLCLIVKDQFFWQFHYFSAPTVSLLRRFIERVPNANKTIVRIPLSVGIHTHSARPLLRSLLARADGRIHQSRVLLIYFQRFFLLLSRRFFLRWNRSGEIKLDFDLDGPRARRQIRFKAINLDEVESSGIAS